MKITKTLLTVTSAIALLSIPALADDARLCSVSNNHGQSIPAYRVGETTIAVSAGGAGAGNNMSSSNCTSTSCGTGLTSRDNAHGQRVLMFR